MRHQGGESFEDTADVVISAMGHLERWDWPEIPGLDHFEGKLMHSAQWDEDFEHSLDAQENQAEGSGWGSKRVAVIGVVSICSGRLQYSPFEGFQRDSDCSSAPEASQTA